MAPPGLLLWNGESEMSRTTRPDEARSSATEPSGPLLPTPFTPTLVTSQTPPSPGVIANAKFGSDQITRISAPVLALITVTELLSEVLLTTQSRLSLTATSTGLLKSYRGPERTLISAPVLALISVTESP